MEEKILKEGIEEYNKYRSPRATAKLLEFDGKQLKIEFKGTFDTSCCMDEYFLDLVYELEEKGINVEFLNYNLKKNKYVAVYEVKDEEV